MAGGVPSRRRDGRFVPAPDAPAEELDKIKSGSAMLLVRHLRGKLALHGAVIELGGKAVALVGRSGQGKSTLAAALCGSGAALFADDAIATDRVEQGHWMVLPTEAKHWLDASARQALGDPEAEGWTGKWPSRAVAVGAEAVVLAAIVVIVFDETVDRARLVRTGGLDALASLV
ncbi:MAG: Serine kinase of the HPr protein regulates carbohydrate metabolism, partial [Labilithrix sp.]|nr:Serine kinase of the HPr protein regulates carbohydrate metabolism [Labilithrix sp.]